MDFRNLKTASAPTGEKPKESRDDYKDKQELVEVIASNEGPVWFGVALNSGEVLLWPDVDVLGNEYRKPVAKTNLPGSPFFVVAPVGFKMTDVVRSEATKQALELVEALKTGKKPSKKSSKSSTSEPEVLPGEFDAPK
jgi:hypothetical protein